jgi:xanthine/uracil/vitamin C permease (AzgA family)
MGMNRFFQLFQLEANGTTLQRELVGGVATFLAMSYIMFVQPDVLSQAGMSSRAVMCATCLSAAFANILMGLLANYPVALAAGVGENFFFLYTPCGTEPLRTDCLCRQAGDRAWAGVSRSGLYLRRFICSAVMIM